MMIQTEPYQSITDSYWTRGSYSGDNVSHLGRQPGAKSTTKPTSRSSASRFRRLLNKIHQWPGVLEYIETSTINKKVFLPETPLPKSAAKWGTWSGNHSITARRGGTCSMNGCIIRRQYTGEEQWGRSNTSSIVQPSVREQTSASEGQ